MRKMAVTLIALLGGLIIQAGTTEAETIPVARQAHLMNLLVQDCGSCHGLTMRGGLGSALLPANLDGKDDTALAELILDGIPETPMPPWRGQLTLIEARWMVKQLKLGVQP